MIFDFSNFYIKYYIYLHVASQENDVNKIFIDTLKRSENTKSLEHLLQNDKIRAEFLLMLESQLKAAKCFKDSFPEAL